MSTEVKDNIVNIKPLGKWKRIILFIADHLIAFIIAFTLMNLACVPIGESVTNLSKREEESEIAGKKCDDLLFASELLYYESDETKYDFSNCLEHTFNCYLSFYCLDEESSSEYENSQYGKKDENEIFIHYYEDILHDVNSYYEELSALNDKYSYFDISSENVISLKSDIKEQLLPFFDQKDELSEDGLDIYDNLENKVFLNLYSSMLKSIRSKDLVVDDVSFIAMQKIVNDFSTYYRSLMAVCSGISYFLGWLICYLIVPLCNKNKRTISMMMMHIERIGMNNMFLVKRREIIFNSIYQLIMNAGMLLLMSSMQISFSYLLSIPLVPVIGLYSLIFVIASLITLLINQYNRSLTDILSRSVMIKDADLDEIYKAKGYYC